MDARISLLGGLRSALVSATSTEDGTLAATASASWDEQKGVQLNVGSWPIVIPTPLGFPLELTATLYIDVGAKASFEVGVTTSVHQHASFTIGASYADGHFAPVCPPPTFSARCQPPTLYGKAELKAYMGPELDTTFYSLAGPTVAVDGYGAFDADSTAIPWWTLHGGLEGSVGFVLQIFSHTIALVELLAYLLRSPLRPGAERLDAAADALTDRQSLTDAHAHADVSSRRLPW